MAIVHAQSDRAHLYRLGKAAAETPALSYAMSGRLYLSKSGWVLLSVPNAFGKGVFDALNEPGIELPTDHTGQYNAHISVIRPEELDSIGGPDKITERGHSFRYTLQALETVTPAGWAEMSRVWFVKVKSPELEKLRKSYGLSAKPKNNEFEFHITVAVRRRRVLMPSSEVIKVSEWPVQLSDVLTLCLAK